MKFFVADPEPPADLCERKVQECDVFVGLLGFRYGSKIDGDPTSISYTEHEYEVAGKAAKTRLMFLLSQNALGMPADLPQPDGDDKRQREFRQRVRKSHTLREFRSAKELKREIRAALTNEPVHPWWIWLKRRWLRVVVSVAVLVAAVFLIVPPLLPDDDQPKPPRAVCGPGKANDCTGPRLDVPAFGKSPRLTNVQEAIFKQNQCVKDRDPVRAIYIAGLTTNTDESEAAQAEELEGLYLQQARRNGRLGETDDGCGEVPPGSGLPALQVAITNGGVNMANVEGAAREILSFIKEPGPPTIGVVGFDRSTDEVEKALSKLGAAGIPVIGTVLSANDVGGDSEGKFPNYYQMVPSNNAQASAIRSFILDRLSLGKDSKAYVVAPEPPTDDLYLRTLRQAVVREFRDNKDRAIPIANLSGEADVSDWSSAQDHDVLCGVSSEKPGVVVYLGRSTEFKKFLASEAECLKDVPLIAGDAIATLAAAVRSGTTLPGAPGEIRFVSKAPALIRMRLNCDSAEAKIFQVRREFCAELKQARKYLGINADQWLGERAGSSYDAVELLYSAVQAIDAQEGQGAGRYQPAAIAEQLSHPEIKNICGAVTRYNFNAANLSNGALRIATLTVDSDSGAQIAVDGGTDRQSDPTNLCAGE